VEVVVNTSIIISALLKEGLTRRMIFFSPFELYTVAYAREEIEKHRKLFTSSKCNVEHRTLNLEPRTLNIEHNKPWQRSKDSKTSRLGKQLGK
jgi:predicted nucleic acid-binding protein